MVFCAGLLLSASSGDAVAQVCATQTYHAAGAGVRVRIEGPGEVVLHDPRFGEAVASARVGPGEVDLSRVFPDLTALLSGPVMFAQFVAQGEAVGSALVIEPLRPIPGTRDAWSTRATRAIESGEARTIESLVRMPERAREALRREVEIGEATVPVEFAVRTYEESVVVIRTTAGTLTLALRPDEAPRTAFHVRSLVEGGFFDGIEAGRLDDAEGRPVCVRIGESAGEGCGWTVPFERSGLSQRLGTVSLLRRADDPNSGSSTLVVWLRAEASEQVEFTGFAEAVDGAPALRAMLTSRGERLRVIEARLAPAPPIGARREVVRRVEREEEERGR